MTVTLEYLEDERKKLWAEVVKQTELLSMVSSNIQNFAQQLNEVKQIAESKVSKDEIPSVVEAENPSLGNNSLENINGSIQEISQQVNSMKSVLDQKSLEIEKIYSAIININQNYNEELDKYSASINEERNSTIDDIKKEIEKTNEIIKEVAMNMQNFKAKSLEHKNGIDKIYNEIFGTYEQEPEVSKESLKNDEEYNALTKNIENLKEDFNQLKNNKNEEFERFKNEQDLELNKLKEKMQSFMDDAASMDLSSVYSQKKRKEEKEKTKAKIAFDFTIILLTLVSVLPICACAYLFFYLRYDASDIIKYLPVMFGLIVPVYIPLVWIGVVLNKKIYQTKKLIEEYTQKETISKTYENLSRELEKPESEDGLKEKVLQNIIMTSTECPEILKEDFNKANFPMIEVIDKFANLLKSAKSSDELQAIADRLANVNENTNQEQVENQQ